jgi:hypothetical protein
MTKHSALLFGLLLWLPVSASADSSGTAVSLASPSQSASNAKTSTNVAAKPKDPAWKAPFAVTAIFYLGDSYLDDGNYKALTGFPLEYFSNEPPWGTDVNVALGFRAVGRWTAAGRPPNPLGNNYAVSGASISGSLTPADTSFRGQANLMLSDYPKGLPAGSLVVAAIGTNDIIAAISAGGIWSTNLSGWRLQHSGFTVPAVGSSVTVQVSDTTGIVAGPINRIIFPDSPGVTMLVVTAVNVGTSTVTLTNVTGTPGTKVSPNAKFEMAASDILDSEIPIFTRTINALLADGANLVLTLPWRTDCLPLYNQSANQGLAYSTWLYLYSKMAVTIFVNTPQVLYFSVSDFFDAVFLNFSANGFLYNYPGWNNNPNVSANEYVFWDSAHPSGKMHQLIASDFIKFLTLVGLAAHR